MSKLRFHRLRRKIRIIFLRLFAGGFAGQQHLMLLIAVVVGSLTGLGAVLFRWLLTSGGEFLRGDLYQWLQDTLGVTGKYMLPLIPAAGGFIVGLLTHFFAREAKGHGVPEVMAAVAIKGGFIRMRVAVAKIIASTVCIASGGSCGREGPIVQIGSSIGSSLGQLFRSSPQRMRIMVGCGAAAGIAATFNAPIAGALFSLEVILGNFALTYFAPVIISSVSASIVSRAIQGDFPAFFVPAYQLVSAKEFPLYVILGLAAGLVAIIFTRTLYLFEDGFDGIKKLPEWLKPAIGGALVGGIGLFFPQVFGVGYDSIDVALGAQMALGILLLLVVFKVLATSLTLGSGGSGGIFAPSLFMGAMLGAALGTIYNYFWPGWTAHPGAYAMVGMAAVVAGTTSAPISAMLIIFEMTMDYKIILPLMVSVAISTLITRLYSPESIYTLKLVRRGINLRQGYERGVLDSLTVADVMKRNYVSISAGMRFRELLALMERTDEDCYPVIDEYGKFHGLVSFQNIRSLMRESAVMDLVVADEIATHNYLSVHPEETLSSAIRKFDLSDADFLPVVDAQDESKLLGVLHHRDLMISYQKQLSKIGDQL